MARQANKKQQPKKKKVKVKTTLKTKAQVVKKGNQTTVAKNDTTSKIPVLWYVPDNGAVFKIKIKKK